MSTISHLNALHIKFVCTSRWISLTLTVSLQSKYWFVVLCSWRCADSHRAQRDCSRRGVEPEVVGAAIILWAHQRSHLETPLQTSSSDHFATPQLNRTNAKGKLYAIHHQCFICVKDGLQGTERRRCVGERSRRFSFTPCAAAYRVCSSTNELPAFLCLSLGCSRDLALDDSVKHLEMLHNVRASRIEHGE